MKYYKFDTISGGCACCTKSYNEKILVPEEFITTIHDVHKLCEQLVSEFYEKYTNDLMDRKDTWPNSCNHTFLYSVEFLVYNLDKYERAECDYDNFKFIYSECILALNEENLIQLHLIKNTETKEFSVSLELYSGYHGDTKTVTSPDLSFNSIKPLILQAYNNLIEVITKNKPL